VITKRIIACLDVHGGRVVKGVQFVDLVDAGDPATQAARHAREGADEIVLLDITATHEGRQTLLDTVRRTARELFVPSVWVEESVLRMMQLRCLRPAPTR